LLDFPALISQFRNSGGYCRSMLPKSSRRASAISRIQGTSLRRDAAMTSFTLGCARDCVTLNFGSCRVAELKADVLVLGAGMVGVGAALHLQKKGRDTVLIDRHELAGEETSYGNGGLIESASVFPYMFPRDLRQILQYATNRTPQLRYHFADLPSFLPCALLPGVVAGTCAAQCDGRTAADPAQPGRA
jgi:hypothetical protein